MTLDQELFALERLLWTGGADAYRHHVAEDALLVVPYQVLDKARTVAEIEAAPRWDDIAIADPRIVRLGDDTVVVAYEGTGRRGEVSYSALVSSTYARRDGAWVLVFHHQTPLPQASGG